MMSASQPQWVKYLNGIIAACAIGGNLALAFGLWMDHRVWSAVASYGIFITLLQIATAACAFGISEAGPRYIGSAPIKLSAVSLLGGIVCLLLTRSLLVAIWIGCLLLVVLLYVLGTNLRGGRLAVAWLLMLVATSFTWLNFLPYGVKIGEQLQQMVAKRIHAQLPETRVVALAREGKVDEVGAMLSADAHLMALAEHDLLEVAISGGNSALLDVLVGQGLKLNQEKYASLVARAIQVRKPGIAIKLIKQGAPFTCSPNDKNSELVLAAKTGSRPLVATMLELQPIDQTRRGQATALLESAATEFTPEADELLAYLIKEGFQFGQEEAAGKVVLETIAPLGQFFLQPPLSQEARESRLRRTRFWVDSNIGIHYVQKDSEYSAVNDFSLMKVVVEIGNTELLKLLLDRGVNPHQGLEPQRDIQAPILVAAWRGKTEMVQLFLSAGLKADRVVLPGGKERVINRQNCEAYRLLIEQGATFDVDQVYTVIQYKDIKSLEVLMSRGFKLKNLDALLVDPIDSSDMELVRYLLDRGASVNVVGKNPPPLVYAVLKRHLGMVRLLCSRGADPNVGGGGFKTPLEIAKEKQFSEIVTALEEPIRFGK